MNIRSSSSQVSTHFLEQFHVDHKRLPKYLDNAQVRETSQRMVLDIWANCITKMGSNDEKKIGISLCIPHKSNIKLIIALNVVRSFKAV